jgi:hypothetical protein
VCQHIIILAERPGHRYISQCEHGTVHLAWDAIGVHLAASKFVQLAGHILQMAATQSISSQREPNPHGCRIQIGRSVLELAWQDFVPLADMVQEALPHVEVFDGCRTIPCLTFPQPQRTLILN